MSFMKYNKEFTNLQRNVSINDMFLLIHTLRSFEKKIQDFHSKELDRLPISTSVYKAQR